MHRIGIGRMTNIQDFAMIRVGSLTPTIAQSTGRPLGTHADRHQCLALQPQRRFCAQRRHDPWSDDDFDPSMVAKPAEVLAADVLF
jgi:hypothetical protein